jgi:acyl-CoA thioesterase YciA
MSEATTVPPDSCPSIRRLMMPRDTNAVGTIFGGVILSEVDLAAAIGASENHTGSVVTVSMDKVDFKAPVYVGDLVSFYAKTERVGRTSVTVRVDVWSQRRFGGSEMQHVTEAVVTMVAVNEDMKPIPLVPRA